jgi:hypothetical protein
MYSPPEWMLFLWDALPTRAALSVFAKRRVTAPDA